MFSVLPLYMAAVLMVWYIQCLAIIYGSCAGGVVYYFTIIYGSCTDVMVYEFNIIYDSCTDSVVYNFTIIYGSCTDGVVYLVFCIYDRYEILLYKLKYVLLLLPLYHQCKVVIKNRSSCLHLNFDIEF